MARLVTDELRSIIEMMCVRHPDVSRDTVAALVHQVYQELAAQARVTTHLIPLTVNRCRKRLTETTAAPPSRKEVVTASTMADKDSSTIGMDVSEASATVDLVRAHGPALAAPPRGTYGPA